MRRWLLGAGGTKCLQDGDVWRRRQGRCESVRGAGAKISIGRQGRPELGLRQVRRCVSLPSCYQLGHPASTVRNLLRPITMADSSVLTLPHAALRAIPTVFAGASAPSRRALCVVPAAAARVVLTREAGKNDKMKQALALQGIEAVELPLIEHAPGPDRCGHGRCGAVRRGHLCVYMCVSRGGGREGRTSWVGEKGCGALGGRRAGARQDAA